MDALEACVVAGAVKNPWQASALNSKNKNFGHTPLCNVNNVNKVQNKNFEFKNKKTKY